MKCIEKFLISTSETIIVLIKLIIFLLLLPFLFFMGAFKKRKNGFPYIKGMNTEYKISCPDCGYENKYMIGTAHTFEEPRVFYTLVLAYCPKCKEPIATSIGTGDREKCSLCGSELKIYELNSKVKLRCPKCLSNKVKVVDLERVWMT